MPRALIVALLMILLIDGASAAPLAPSKPSDVVTLVTAPEFCNIQGPDTGLVYNTRIQPDGTAEPFTIPLHRVLVITGFDWADVAVASEVALVHIHLGNPVGRAVQIGAALAGANGHVGASTVIPGIVVRAGTPICIDRLGVLHGFLARDN